MAPVGSYESLMAAIQGGADSIYFGIEGLNMRSRSSNNFTTDDLRKIVALCREHGIKSYLTVNTVIYGEDLPLMREIIDAAKEAEVSAIIAADVAAMNYANSIGQEVHLSTQLNISNAEALKFYARFADVVVLSLHEMNASANRGACMQICRRAYSVKDKDSNIELDIENQYIMSPKDLKTIHFMNKMMDAGVRVFKIEGRARGPEYVRLVTECYKEAVRAYCNGTFDEKKVAAWDERLRSVFNRGFWDGYYLGQRLGEWSSKYGSGATKKKVYVAKGIKYFDKIGVAEFEMESGNLKVGDEILITGPTTGAVMQTIEEIRVDLKPVDETVKGERFSLKVNEKIRPSDRLYKMEKVQLEKVFE